MSVSVCVVCFPKQGVLENTWLSCIWAEENNTEIIHVCAVYYVQH